jgi:lysyl-tRNA synthetase class 2
VSEWFPSASPESLAARAELLRVLRRFFVDRGVLEVDTPLLSQGTIPDAGIDVFRLPGETDEPDRYLQTSPESAMKRLLAAGVGDIFQICKAFRQGEAGRHHNPEFTLLEWYRVGWDHAALMREVAELLGAVMNVDNWQIWPYRALFIELLGVDPLDEQTSLTGLTDLAQSRIGVLPESLDRDAVLDLLMSHCIEPEISDWGMVFVTDFPTSQAAMARCIPMGDVDVAARFECYLNGKELANGYWEQIDPDALAAQLHAENTRRQQRGLSLRPIDGRLLAAHRHGLPECAGVALGVDRLLALKLGVEGVAETISFGWDRA